MISSLPTDSLGTYDSTPASSGSRLPPVSAREISGPLPCSARRTEATGQAFILDSPLGRAAGHADRFRMNPTPSRSVSPDFREGLRRLHRRHAPGGQHGLTPRSMQDERIASAAYCS